MFRSLSIFSVLGLVCVLVAALPALAEAPVYKVGGVDFNYTYPPEATGAEGLCPFGTHYSGKNEQGKSGLEVFRDAAKDSDGCPVAYQEGKPHCSGTNTTNCDPGAPLAGCRSFYQDFAKREGPKISEPPDAKRAATMIGCCHKSARSYGSAKSARLDCLERAIGINADTRTGVARQGNETGNPVPGVNAPSDVKDVAEQKRTYLQTQRECFNRSLDRIQQFWGAKRAVACVRSATRLIKSMGQDIATKAAKEALIETKHSTDAQTVGLSATPFNAVGLSLLLGKLGIDTGKRLSNLAKVANTLLTDCGGIIPGLSTIQEFRNSVMGTECSPLINLLERQMTQCIRADFQLDLRLPHFSMALQCPFNFSVSARLSPQGFDCYADSSVQSPMGYGSIGILQGGSKNLFSGTCFKGGSDDDGDVSNGVNGRGKGDPVVNGGTRIPGIDCGALSDAPQRQSVIVGTRILPSGRTSNGWAVGQSETVAGVQITRCDFFELGRRQRTTYVYGSGTSCSSSANGFLEDGAETNTACYPGGGYRPFTVDIPDACMYPSSCLDTSGRFSEAFLGKGSCLAYIQPAFDAKRFYAVFTSNGVNGGNSQFRSCKDFDVVNDEPAPICCDPQTQNCAPLKAGVSLCRCDEGDANNNITDPATGECKQGGNKTCCSPRLNGGTEGCAGLGYGASDICPGEVSECVKPDDPDFCGTYTSPSGLTQRMCADQLTSSKPSPYIYLFVRTDGRINGQSCCTSEWCNICPQHYANAYGLSLVRANMSGVPNSDADNNALLGKGWPYIENGADELGGISYQVGVNPLTLILDYPGDGKEGGAIAKPFVARYPLLSMDSNMMSKPTDATLSACNGLSSWKAGYYDSAQVQESGAMGYVQDFYMDQPSKNEYRLFSAVPEMQETPLAYLNRLRDASANGDGTPLEPIQLCEKVVKYCEPGAPTDGALNPSCPLGKIATANGCVPITPGGGNIPQPTDTSGAGGTPTNQPVISGGGGDPIPTDTSNPATLGGSTVKPTNVPSGASTGSTTGPQTPEGLF